MVGVVVVFVLRAWLAVLWCGCWGCVFFCWWRAGGCAVDDAMVMCPSCTTKE